METPWKAVSIVRDRHDGTWTRVLKVGLERKVKKRDISGVDSTGFDAATCRVKSSPASHGKPNWSLLPVCPGSSVTDANTPVMPE